MTAGIWKKYLKTPAFDLEMDMDQYTPLPTWFWPESHKDLDNEFDLLAFSYRDILHTNNTTFQNPYVDEVSKMCPLYLYHHLEYHHGGEKGAQRRGHHLH